MRKRSAGNILQSRLVVHDHVTIITGVLVDLSLEDAVDEAVAALALRAAHDEHVEIIVFDQTAIHHHFHIVSLGHSGRNLTCRTICRTLHILTDLAECHFHIHTEDLIQIGIGIRIHSQYRGLSLVAEILNQQTAKSRFSNAAFSGDGNYMCHWKHLLKSIQTIRSSYAYRMR